MHVYQFSLLESMSLDVKIEKYLLPPSKISALQSLPVASFIFGRLFVGINAFRSRVQQTSSKVCRVLMH